MIKKWYEQAWKFCVTRLRLSNDFKKAKDMRTGDSLSELWEPKCRWDRQTARLEMILILSEDFQSSCTYPLRKSTCVPFLCLPSCRHGRPWTSWFAIGRYTSVARFRKLKKFKFSVKWRQMAQPKGNHNHSVLAKFPRVKYYWENFWILAHTVNRFTIFLKIWVNFSEEISFSRIKIILEKAWRD